jgi:hypothetical protein
MPTHTTALMAEARRLANLQAKARKQRKDLKATEDEIKLVKKNVKALASRPLDEDDQLPSRWAPMVK